MANEKQARSSLKASVEVGAAFLVAGAEEIARLQVRIDYLENLLARAYPMMANPYTQQIDPHMATLHATILNEVETVVAKVPDAGLDEEDRPVTLPCASCDGDGCPNCAIDAILRASD